jgi:hypothetical protein
MSQTQIVTQLVHKDTLFLAIGHPHAAVGGALEVAEPVPLTELGGGVRRRAEGVGRREEGRRERERRGAWEGRDEEVGRYEKERRDGAKEPPFYE